MIFLSNLFCFGLQKYKMNFDKNTGVIEMIMDSLTPADEGTFTFQLQDGKATNQSSLVLIGDGTFSQTIMKLFLPLSELWLNCFRTHSESLHSLNTATLSSGHWRAVKALKKALNDNTASFSITGPNPWLSKPSSNSHHYSVIAVS